MTDDQLSKLTQIEQWLMEIIASPEFETLTKSDYQPDVTLGDAREAVSYLLDYCNKEDLTQ